MLRKLINSRLLVIALIAFTVASCTEEEVAPKENLAFSSNSNPVLLDETIAEADLDKIFTITGTTDKAEEQGTVKLGFVVKENSQNPGAVYLYLSESDVWKKINEDRGSSIAGFWSTLSKNESRKARLIQEGTNSNAVYLFFGNGNVPNYKKFFVDNGEILKAHNQPIRTLPGGFGAGDLFYHDSNRADFPASWLGIKGKSMYNFGSKLDSTPELIPVRKNGFNGTDLNGKINRIEGYWNPNKQRIIIRVDGGKNYTLQKERYKGTNFYKS
jgi:hypothetical protein